MDTNPRAVCEGCGVPLLAMSRPVVPPLVQTHFRHRPGCQGRAWRLNQSTGTALCVDSTERLHQIVTTSNFSFLSHRSSRTPGTEHRAAPPALLVLDPWLVLHSCCGFVRDMRKSIPLHSKHYHDIDSDNFQFNFGKWIHLQTSIRNQRLRRVCDRRSWRRWPASRRLH